MDTKKSDFKPDHDVDTNIIPTHGVVTNIIPTHVKSSSHSDQDVAAAELDHSVQKEQEKSETKSLLIALVVIISLVIVVLLAIRFYPSVASPPMTIADLHQANLNGEIDPSEGLVYNGFSFVKLDGLWWGEVMRNSESVHIRLHFNPAEVENISISGSLNASFNSGLVIYQAINPDVANKYYTLALTELNSNVVQGINRKVVAACTREDPICEDRIIVSCANTQGFPVIELIPDSSAFVQLQGSCIGIHGENMDLVRAAERVLYQWYGVMG